MRTNLNSSAPNYPYAQIEAMRDVMQSIQEENREAPQSDQIK